MGLNDQFKKKDRTLINSLKCLLNNTL
ncbi:MAG: hypothetical protein JWQ30_528, partial [Sediminibacterium sp.]|nr:hypothetical protein [Sediminibacterium sp.]